MTSLIVFNDFFIVGSKPDGVIFVALIVYKKRSVRCFIVINVANVIEINVNTDNVVGDLDAVKNEFAVIVKRLFRFCSVNGKREIGAGDG